MSIIQDSNSDPKVDLKDGLTRREVITNSALALLSSLFSAGCVKEKAIEPPTQALSFDPLMGIVNTLRHGKGGKFIIQ